MTSMRPQRFRCGRVALCKWVEDLQAYFNEAAAFPLRKEVGQPKIIDLDDSDFNEAAAFPLRKPKAVSRPMSEGPEILQ